VSADSTGEPRFLLSCDNNVFQSMAICYARLNEAAAASADEGMADALLANEHFARR